MYSAKTIANAFLDISSEHEKQLTNMKLQKLVYFAHGWSLALDNGPLIHEAVKAWNFGPVIPPLYNVLRKYGNGVVKDKIEGINEEIEKITQPLIKRIWEVYNRFTGIQLSAMTHRKNSAWDITYGKEPFSIIDNKLIAEEFKKKLKKHG